MIPCLLHLPPVVPTTGIIIIITPIEEVEDVARGGKAEVVDRIIGETDLKTIQRVVVSKEL